MAQRMAVKDRLVPTREAVAFECTLPSMLHGTCPWNMAVDPNLETRGTLRGPLFTAFMRVELGQQG